MGDGLNARVTGHVLSQWEMGSMQGSLVMCCLSGEGVVKCWGQRGWAIGVGVE